MRGPGLAIVVLTLMLLQPASPTGANFHISYTSEIMSGFAGDPDVQYLEVRMEFPGQHLVNDTRISAWNADGSEFEVLLLLDRDLPNDGVTVYWIAATQAFADLTGMTPDFTLPAGIHAPSGMVCWGAPDFAPPSDEWDPRFPFLYTDCVAYGGYSGGNSFHVPPSELPPGDGVKSLERILPAAQTAGRGQAAHLSAPPDAEAFALRCPSPENNAGEVVLMGDDGDGDGLPDCHEGEQGTNPALSDTDGDGFSDGEEFFAGSDPNDPASTPDPTPTPIAGLQGDADGNGGVSSLDALFVLQHVAGLFPELPCPLCADVTGEGKVNAIDASVILQFVAGLLSEL
ncbi:MAG: dockerin type I domain-containing protein [Dehalococcoidia bacterium]